MRASIIIPSLLAVASAAPVELQVRDGPKYNPVNRDAWNSGATNEWQIHPSCNASQALQIRNGLDEAAILAKHGRDHALRFGNSSAVYRKYFGNQPPIEVIGALDVIDSGDRARAIFRCDDIDGNCKQPSWNGHWRGNNATDETVICPLSFFTRRPISTICSQGWTVSNGTRAIFWGSDLIHRLYHMPAYGFDYIEHFSEGYPAIIDAAKKNSPNNTHDTDVLQYYVLEAYAFDVINPGEGCPGPKITATSSAAAAAAATSAASATSSVSRAAATSSSVAAATSSVAAATSAAAAPATSAAAAATSATVGANCHTHANGDIHCT